MYKVLTLFQSLLTCEALKQGSKGQDSPQPKYSDIFIEDMRKLTAITKVLHQKLENFSLQVSRQASQPSSSATTDVIVISTNPVDMDLFRKDTDYTHTFQKIRYSIKIFLNALLLARLLMS